MRDKFKKPYKARRTRYAKTKARQSALVAQVKKIVQREANKTMEGKIGDYSTEPMPLSCYYHNVPYVHDTDMLYCAQGTTDEEIALARNRIGDSIYCKHIDLALMITNFQTRPNLVYRITVIKTKQGATSLPNPFGHPQCGNSIISPVDTELPGIVSVVYDRVFDSRAFQTAQDGNEDKKFIWKYRVKVNRKIRYDNGNQNSSSNSYQLWVTCYDSQAVLITDNVARFSYMRRMTFIDN